MLLQRVGAPATATRGASPPNPRLQSPPLAMSPPLRPLGRSATSGRGSSSFGGHTGPTGSSQPSSTAPSSTEAGRASWQTLWNSRTAVRIYGPAAAAAAAADAAAAAEDVNSKRVLGDIAKFSKASLPSTSPISPAVSILPLYTFARHHPGRPLPFLSAGNEHDSAIRWVRSGALLRPLTAPPMTGKQCSPL